MESSSYDEVLKVNQRLYSSYAQEYKERTQNGHANYLKTFIERFVGELTGRKVYDLGCGPGRDLAFFIAQGLDATGIDCSEGMLAICAQENLPAIKGDFVNDSLPASSADGIWAYTSHTLIPKKEFSELLRRHKDALIDGTGILALGMIEGSFEGWKSDSKYDGQRRFIARYTREELEDLLRQHFGSVWVERVPVGKKVYLHCLCKKTPVPERDTIRDAARTLFNRFSDVYWDRTQTGIALLDEDRELFARKLEGHFGAGVEILDLGCGPGRDCLLFASRGMTVTGFDLSETNVDQCRKRGIHAIAGDMYDIDTLFCADQFAGIWCNCSLTNWIIKSDIRKIGMSIKRICKPRGLIFIGSVLGGFSGWEQDSKYDGLPRYNTHWDHDELLQALSFMGSPIHERELRNTGNKNYLNLCFTNAK